MPRACAVPPLLLAALLVLVVLPSALGRRVDSRGAAADGRVERSAEDSSEENDIDVTYYDGPEPPPPPPQPKPTHPPLPGGNYGNWQDWIKPPSGGYGSGYGGRYSGGYGRRRRALLIPFRRKGTDEHDDSHEEASEEDDDFVDEDEAEDGDAEPQNGAGSGAPARPHMKPCWGWPMMPPMMPSGGGGSEYGELRYGRQRKSKKSKEKKKKKIA